MSFSLLFALYVGFTHAFETDHLLAVSNIVTNRNKTIKAIKDGMYWGFGHTSTILLMGVFILVFRFAISEIYFKWLEAGVGIMLFLLGIFRIYKWYKEKYTFSQEHINVTSHSVIDVHHGHSHNHFPAYNVGLIHGLAGSGSLILLVMGESQSFVFGLAYLFIFGIGSVIGMMLAVGVFSLPFSQKIVTNKSLQTILLFSSALLCIVYGSWVFYKNIFLS